MLVPRRRFSIRGQVLVSIFCLAAVFPSGGLRAEEPRKIRAVHDGIVNGVGTLGFPSVARLDIDLGTGDEGTCTGTLIGCETVLTAAHCFCEEPPCHPTPADDQVYFPHAGFFGVESVAIHPEYDFGTAGDVAVVRLAERVDGVLRSRINRSRRPAPGTSGTVVGFGNTRGDLPETGGLKRGGSVLTSACPSALVNPVRHLCWRFEAPLGAPGENSNSCQGDSGGPLLVDFGSGVLLAGVVSGGSEPDCLPSDTAWNADVFVERSWIASQAGADLHDTACGSLPHLGEPGTDVSGVESDLSVFDDEERWSLDVAPGTDILRVGLIGEESADFDLAVFPRGATTPRCLSENAGPSPEFCEIRNPRSGEWTVEVSRFDGSGDYQLVLTSYGASSAGECAPGPSTLCIDDQPGDRRFEVESTFETVQGGGASGKGGAIPLASLGVSRGGLFWFFAADNPELLVKVLNVCVPPFNRYWVFYSAGTNVGFTLTVTDTVTGRVWSDTNPDLAPAAPVQDVEAFPCN